MPHDADSLLAAQLAAEEKIIRSFYTVYNRMGTGFLERVYAGALVLECRRRGLTVRREVPIAVRYDGVVVGAYRADLLVNGVAVVETKIGAQSKAHYAQLLNYLRCSDIKLGILLYFDHKPEFRRIRLGDRR